MRVGVVGTGHVGLVTAATLAEIGHDVVATDHDREKIAQLEQGKSPFYEPELEELVVGNTQAGRLSFSRDDAPAVEGAAVVFICVGTPARASGEANLAAVERAGTGIAQHASGRLLVVEKSTVPAGTAQRLKRALRMARPDLVGEIEVASNPEFLREGQAVHDSLNPERILVGADTEWAIDVMRELYQPLIDKGSVFIPTDIATSELAKHACNAFLALKISYINALARLCERAGADVVSVAEVMGLDERIGPHFLGAGLGYGGYCFPKDLAAFDQLASRLGYDFGLLKEIARINDEAIKATVDKIEDALWNLEGKRVALLGLSFKPGTDDIRLSPALALAAKLLEENAQVVGYDPKAMGNVKAEMPEIELVSDVYDALSGAHCVVVCTAWPEFAELDFERARNLVASPVIVDARNFLDGKRAQDAGFSYYPTGRPPRVLDAG